jgi:hypothetical protein
VGTAAATFKFEDNSGVIRDNVQLNQYQESPPIKGTKADSKFDGDLVISKNGNEIASLHLSCSDYISIGLQYGDLKVTGGRSKDGGLLCDCSTFPEGCNPPVKSTKAPKGRRMRRRR